MVVGVNNAENYSNTRAINDDKCSNAALVTNNQKSFTWRTQNDENSSIRY